MAYIDKLLNKFNKVQNSINSLKGIASKIQSLNYNTEIDKLGERKAEALNKLTKRNAALKEINTQSGLSTNFVKERPKDFQPELVYPVHDDLANYLVFEIRDRKVENDLPADIIALYIPDELISQSSVSFGATEVSPLAKAFSGLLDAMSSPTGDAGKAGAEGAKAVLEKGKQALKNFLTGGISSIKTGVAINPQKETTLNPLEFRTFSFNYQFNARSEQEAEIVRKIIHTFRMAMLPDGTSKSDFQDDEGKTVKLGKNEVFFSFPNVFDIYFDGPIGDKVDGYLPAVCTSAEVNYTGGQKFATHYDGQPVKIDLALSFQEIRVMTRGNYKQISAYTNTDPTQPNIAAAGESVLDNTTRG